MEFRDDASPLSSTHQAQIAEVFQRAPVISWLGLELTDLSRGGSKTRLRVGPEHLQHLGVVHGGVLSIMAGHTALAAAMSLDETGGALVAADFNISIFRSANIDDQLQAEGSVLKAGKRAVFVQCNLNRQIEGTLQALASGRFTLNYLAKPC